MDRDDLWMVGGFKEGPLSKALKVRCLPDMEGNKFNLTPVDWVAKVRFRKHLWGNRSLLWREMSFWIP